MAFGKVECSSNMVYVDANMSTSRQIWALLNNIVAVDMGILMQIKLRK